jgi:hypothetical protein
MHDIGSNVPFALLVPQDSQSRSDAGLEGAICSTWAAVDQACEKYGLAQGVAVA